MEKRNHKYLNRKDEMNREEIFIHKRSFINHKFYEPEGLQERLQKWNEMFTLGNIKN